MRSAVMPRRLIFINLSNTLLLLFLVAWSTTTNGQQQQQFIAQPRNTTVNKGQLVILQCIVENLIGNVQWLRNGFGLGPGPTYDGYPRYRVDYTSTGQYNLVIANAQLEDDAAFQCQVSPTDTTPPMQSLVAQLTVQQPPQSVTINTGVQTIDIIANSTSSLQCVATGARPAASLSWRMVSAEASQFLSADSVVVQTNGLLSSTTGAVTIKPTVDDSGSRYSCLATNNATGASSPVVNSVQINVIYAPTVTIAVTPSANIKEFDRVVFTCKSQANPSTVSWQWYVGDDLQNGDHGSSLVVSSITRQYVKKTVSCVATNTVGSARSSSSVVMTYGPKFINQPVNQYTDLGAALAVLTCNIDSNPPANIEWTRSSSPLLVRARGSQLTFSPVTRESVGSYTCTASVPGFAPVAADVQLTFNGPPQVTTDSKPSAYVGGTATMDCLVSATPKQNSITWTKDGQVIDSATDTRYSIKEQNITGDGSRSCLTITDVRDADFGRYNCTAANNYGSAYLEITLSKRGSIPMTYILAGVIPGVVVIIIIAAVSFACHRRRSLGSELGSDNSESQMTKHMAETVPDHHIDFSNGRFQSPSHSSEPSSGTYSVRSMSQHYDSWGVPIDLPPLFPTVKRALDISGPPDIQSFSRKTNPVSYYRGELIRRPDYVGSPQSAVSLVDDTFDAHTFHSFIRDEPYRVTLPEERIIRLATNV